MDESGRHQDRWRQLQREVIRGLEEEIELLRIREAELHQSALERETVLLELLEAERASRLAAETGAGTAGAPDGPPRLGNPHRPAAVGARNAELLARLCLTNPRIPELESALRARDEELARMRNRKVLRVVDGLARFKRRLFRRR